MIIIQLNGYVRVTASTAPSDRFQFVTTPGADEAPKTAWAALDEAYFKQFGQKLYRELSDADAAPASKKPTADEMIRAAQIASGALPASGPEFIDGVPNRPGVGEPAPLPDGTAKPAPADSAPASASTVVPDGAPPQPSEVSNG